MTELPHTRTRMVHWLTTAAALAAVVGATALVEPSDASARTPTTASSVAATDARSGGAPTAAPDPSRAIYPLDCGVRPHSGSAAGGDGSRSGADGVPLARGTSGAPVEVLDHGSADFDGDGRAETVAVVRCSSGTGSPPHAVFVLAGPGMDQQRPKVAATLVAPGERMNVGDFEVTGRTVSATLLGYSSADVPRCCPDMQRKVKWKWEEGKFELVPAPLAGRV